MTHTEFTLKAFDGLNLFAQRWTPAGKPKAVVNLVHGLGEHSSRYGYVAQEFTKAGYVFNTMDLRGHGKSDGPRGYAPGFSTLVSDIEFLVNPGGQIIRIFHNFYMVTAWVVHWSFSIG